MRCATATPVLRCGSAARGHSRVDPGPAERRHAGCYDPPMMRRSDLFVVVRVVAREKAKGLAFRFFEGVGVGAAQRVDVRNDVRGRRHRMRLHESAQETKAVCALACRAART